MHIPRARNSLTSLLGPVQAAGQLLQIPVEQIVRNEAQPRTHFDPDAIASLAESIQAQGLIQPVAVRQVAPDRFELIAGERRWLAARRAGLATIPAVVHQTTDRDSIVLALAENLVREDLGPLETARAYSRLLDEFGISVADLARALGKSRPAVANTLRLLELPDDVLRAIEERRLSEGHGRALLQLEDRDRQRRMARTAIEHSMSVRALEAAVRRARFDTVGSAPPPSAPPELQARVERLAERALGVRGRVKVTQRSAKLELRCSNIDELLKLVARLEQMA